MANASWMSLSDSQAGCSIVAGIMIHAIMGYPRAKPALHCSEHVAEITDLILSADNLAAARLWLSSRALISCNGTLAFDPCLTVHPTAGTNLGDAQPARYARICRFSNLSHIACAISNWSQLHSYDSNS